MSKSPKSYTDDKNYVLRFYKGNIVEIRYLDDSHVNLEVMKELLQILYNEIGHEPYYSVANFKNIYGAFDEEAKKHIAENKRIEKQRVCEVLLTNSLLVRILLRGYLSFYKPKTVTKIISKISEATSFMVENGLKKSDWDEYLELRSLLGSS